MQVELVYEQSCPNIEGARLQLLRAFSQLGLSPRWQEWETGRETTPQRLRGFGSPTILVNGRDASGDWAESRGECCRVYAHDEQAGRGVPDAGLSEDYIRLMSGEEARFEAYSMLIHRMAEADPNVAQAYLDSLAIGASDKSQLQQTIDEVRSRKRY